MNDKPADILLVEDDINLGFVIKDNLIQADFEVTLCVDGEAGLQKFKSTKFDLCVLDVMLPRKDGFTLAREIRRLDRSIPIIFLTAKGMKEDKINGFEVGGDDYITKPFSIEELICRIQVFLRRSRTGNSIGDSALFQIGGYTLDHSNLMLRINDTEKSLTQKEADLLRMFAMNRNHILKREEILDSLWGGNDYFAGRSLDVFISRLRKYIAHDQNLRITNHHGVGFKLESQVGG